MKNFKIRILSSDHSKAVQLRAMDLGYEWCISGKNVVYTEKNYLFLDSDSDIAYSNTHKLFKDSKHTEITLGDLYRMTPEYIKGESPEQSQQSQETTTPFEIKEDLKFEVLNEEHSKAIQNRLFELGAGWNINDKYLIHTDKPYLFAYFTNIKNIQYASGKDYFDNHENKLVTIDYLYGAKESVKEEKKNLEYEERINRMMATAIRVFEISPSEVRAAVGKNKSVSKETERIREALQYKWIKVSDPIEHEKIRSIAEELGYNLTHQTRRGIYLNYIEFTKTGCYLLRDKHCFEKASRPITLEEFYTIVGYDNSQSEDVEDTIKTLTNLTARLSKMLFKSSKENNKLKQIISEYQKQHNKKS